MERMLGVWLLPIVRTADMKLVADPMTILRRNQNSPFPAEVSNGDFKSRLEIGHEGVANCWLQRRGFAVTGGVGIVDNLRQRMYQRDLAVVVGLLYRHHPERRQGQARKA